MLQRKAIRRVVVHPLSNFALTAPSSFLSVLVLCAACHSNESPPLDSTPSTPLRESPVAVQQQAVTTACPAPAPGYVGYWKFDEGSGDATADSSGLGNNGALGAGTAARKPVWTNGMFGSALQFDGVDDVVGFGNSSAFDITGPITLEAWVVPNADSPPGGEIISKSVLGIYPYELANKDPFRGQPNTLFWRLERSAGVYATGYSDKSSALPVGQWSHVAMVYDRSQVMVYVNGVPAMSPVAHTDPIFSGPTAALYVGSRNDARYPFGGAVDEVRIYNRALSPSEVLNNACTGVSGGIPAVADTTVKSASPLANFGSDAQLTTGPDDYSMVTFDRQVLLAARGAGNFITSARLEVPLTSGSPDVDALPMRTAWNETSATWSCANDRDAANGSESCQNADHWSMARQSGTWANPYYADAVRQGSQSGTKLVFDVTDDVQAFLSTRARSPISWALRARQGASSVLGSREGGQAARLYIDTVSASQVNLNGAPPFSFGVDATLATTDALPPLADGVARPLAVLRTSDGDTLRYVQNELTVMTDSATELDAIKARWNATEIDSPKVQIPGLAKAHLLRIDTSRANTATLVSNLQQLINRPDGLQKVSSTTALRLLAAAADERSRGTVVGVNWVAPGANVDLAGIRANQLTDGTPSPSVAAQWDSMTEGPVVESSSNDFSWTNFNSSMHRVTEAWKLMFFAGKLKPVVDVAIIDTGFAEPFLDVARYKQIGCAGSCSNPLPCGDGNPCPWHGTHVASAGFGVPNNRYGGAGPGAEVSDLTLYWGLGDMGNLLVSIPSLALGGEDIISMSNAIPVPDYLFFTTEPAELTLMAARTISGRLIFAAAGNSNTDVDEKRCIDLWLTRICLWEKKNWFPCESGGVDCVGATNYRSKDKAPYSNYGDSVRYWATGTILTGADPDTAIGNQYQLMTGTSFSAPFMAGTAALTWAGNTSMSAGDVEACLSYARLGGPDGRFVDTYWAATCGLAGQHPLNLPPLVDITNPQGATADFNAVAPVGLVADAADYESASPITTIFWRSDVEGSLGTSAPGQSFVYVPSGPGIRKVTAYVFDPLDSSLSGSDTVSLSFNPAPPNVQVIAPAPGSSVFVNLPTDHIAVATNMSQSQQPCASSVWTGFQGTSIVFDNAVGCTVLGSYPALGASHADARMTANGLTGFGTSAFNVIYDGRLHTKIINPVRNQNLVAFIKNKVPVTLSAVSTAAPAGMHYTWSIRVVGPNNTLLAATLIQGNDVTYTPSFPDQIGAECTGPESVLIDVIAADDFGNTADDHITAAVDIDCHPT